MNLVRASRGSAAVLGVDSRRLGPREFQRIGYVSENQHQPEWMSPGNCSRIYARCTRDGTKACVRRSCASSGSHRSRSRCGIFSSRWCGPLRSSRSRRPGCHEPVAASRHGRRPAVASRPSLLGPAGRSDRRGRGRAPIRCIQRAPSGAVRPGRRPAVAGEKRADGAARLLRPARAPDRRKHRVLDDAALPASSPCLVEGASVGGHGRAARSGGFRPDVGLSRAPRGTPRRLRSRRASLGRCWWRC
jgi:hypothetical protein